MREILETSVTEATPLTTSSMPEAGGQPLPLAISKPAAGTVSLAETAQAAKLAFKFAYAGVKTAVLDVDLVLLFDDGSKILLPGLALRMLGADAPRLTFLDGEIDPQMIIARVDEVQLADQLPNLMVSASLQNPKEDDAANAASGVPIVQLPSLPSAGLTPVPRARLAESDGELNSGLLAPQIGRFARRSNQDETVLNGSGSGSSGGQSDGGAQQVSQEVKTAKNLDPIITSDGGGAAAAFVLNEGLQAVTRVAAQDPEGKAVYFAVGGGPDAAFFAMNSETGELSFAKPSDFESAQSGGNVYKLTVMAFDELGGRASQAVTITLNNVNEAPTDVGLTGGGIAENATNGTFIGDAMAFDPDVGGSVNYAFVPGQDAGGRFAISPMGRITVANESLLDFEAATSHTVTVRVTDQGGLSFDKVMTITVSNVNESPFDVTISNTIVAEDTPNGTVIGTLGAADPDAGSSFTYAFVAGQDAGGRFAINGLNQIVVADGSLLDSEAATSHTVTVRVTDQGGLSFDKVITLSVTNVNEAPTDVTITGTTVAENAANG
ncbi:MAG: cadherin domain-containing protein, partial [Methylocystis sp.]|nr:cadherin domain-containing protein [Methylocystis sp.]